MKRLTLLILLVFSLVGCGGKEPLTAEMAEEIILSRVFPSELVYAEVPRRVIWSSESPKDDYDELSIETLRRLEQAELVTLTIEEDETSGTWEAEVTQLGFDRLGLVPSVRGAALRGWIADKQIDGVRNFIRHPEDPLVGRAEVIFHYQNPTDLYELFTTKIDKPLNEQFVSVVSIYHDRGAWQLRMLVEKERAERNEMESGL